MTQCTTRCRFVAALAAILLLSLPALTHAQTRFDFRAINLVNGSDGIDVHFNDIEQATIIDVDFGIASAVSQGLPAVGGKVNVKIAETGDGLASAFADKDVTVETNREYIGVVHGQGGGRTMTVLERDKSLQPLSGKVLVRVLNTVGDASKFDVYVGAVGSTPIASGLASGDVSTFVNVNAEAAALIVTENGKTQPLVSLTGPFGFGTPYITLIVTGADRNNIRVYAHTDKVTERTELIQLEEASYTNLRVVHLRPNDMAKAGDKLDIYFNRASVADTKVTDTLKYGFASKDFGPLFPSDFRVKFVPAGESPGTSVLTVDQTLGNDTSYVVVLTQFKDRKATPLILTRTPVEPIPGGLGSSKIRFANASAFHTPITLVVGYGDDTMRFEGVEFKKFTEFRSIAIGVPVSLKAYLHGQSTPFFTADPVNLQVPSASYLTLLAYGNEVHARVAMLNESQPGLQQLQTFEPTSSVPAEAVPVATGLQAAPNPAVASARLTFILERAGSIRIELYDAMGRNVGTIADGTFGSGPASVEIPTSELAPGMYTCLMRGGDGSTAATKIVVAR